MDFQLQLASSTDRQLAQQLYARESFIMYERFETPNGAEKFVAYRLEWNGKYFNTLHGTTVSGLIDGVTKHTTPASVKEVWKLFDTCEPARSLSQKDVSEKPPQLNVIWSFAACFAGLIWSYVIIKNYDNYRLLIRASRGNGWRDYQVLDIACPPMIYKEDARRFVQDYFYLDIPAGLQKEVAQQAKKSV